VPPQLDERVALRDHAVADNRRVPVPIISRDRSRDVEHWWFSEMLGA